MGLVQGFFGSNLKLVLLLTFVSGNFSSDNSFGENSLDKSLWSGSDSKWMTIARKNGNADDVCTKKANDRECDATCKYRSYNGMCNNLDYPAWGGTSILLRRIIDAAEFDYTAIPTRTTLLSENYVYHGKRSYYSDVPEDLPSTRLVSQTCTKFHEKRTHDTLHEMFTQFGQFIDHDFDFTPLHEGVTCCSYEPKDQPSQCFQIEVPDNDDFFKKLSITCLEFLRSVEFCPENPDGIRDQQDIVTSYLDASTVYGSSLERSLELRTFEDGKMIIDKNNLLPKKSTSGDDLLAGDDRAHIVPGMAALQTLFTREHNRIAHELKEKYPDMDDDKLFEETRRIIVATIQNIAYGEYLPILFGRDLFDHFSSSSSTYDPNVDGSMINEFSTVSFRFGHSMVSDNIEMWDVSGRGTRPLGAFPLRHNFKNTSLYEMKNGRGMEEVLVGLFFTVDKRIGLPTYKRADQLSLRSALFFPWPRSAVVEHAKRS